MTLRPRARLLPALLLILSALSCPAAFAAPVTVQHAQGSTVVEQVPTRVAVYDLAALDILDALGVEVAGVPATRMPAGLSGYDDARYAKIGSLFEPDLEALRALAPDLVIVGGRSAKKYAGLQTIAPTLDLGAGRDAFASDIVATTLALGRVFGRDAEASRLAGRLLASRAELAARMGDTRGLVLFVVGGRATVHAPGERFGIFHDLALLPSVLPAVAGEEAEGPRPAQGSPEAQQARARAGQRLAEALAADPDWLIVLDRGAATGGEAQARQVLEALPAVTASKAWRSGQVVMLDPPTWYLAPGGIRPAQALLDELLARLPPR